jgi:outer membrane protein OmpA-like peptidoglycan-associated protein
MELKQINFNGGIVMRRIGYGLIFLSMFFLLFTGCATFKPVDLNPRINSGQLVQKTNNFVVLFDKSASMNDRHGKPRFAGNPTHLIYAKDTTKNMIATMPDISLNAGLRTFWAEKTVLIYGMAPLNKEDYTKAVNSIEMVNSRTDLGKAITAAGNDLRGAPGNSALIVVSDFDMSPVVGDIKNVPDIRNEVVIDAITKINAEYGDKLCVYAIQLGYTQEGKDLSEQIVQNVAGGYTVNADRLENPVVMAAFVEKVISGNCDRYQRYVAKPVEKVVIVADEPIVQEKVVAAVAADKVVILAFEDIHFDFDKSTLKPEARAILKRNIQVLKDNPKAKVRIAGYTSASGTNEYNQSLSERRAAAVQEYLISEGLIAPDRLSTIGYGETDPAMYEAAPKELYSKAAKANMRALFQIIVQ